MDDRVLQAIAEINKKSKKELLILGNKLPPIQRIPFSSPKMNYLTRGGMPWGRMVEFVGAEHSGKTTTALDLVAEAQRMGKNCFFVDAENTLDEDWARINGVDVDQLVVMKPTNSESAEEILQTVLTLIDTGVFGLGVVDSIPFLIPKAALEGSMDDKTYCGNSGALTQFTGKVIGKLAKTGTLLVMINQLRDKIQSTYVAYNTPGGRALKHAYSFRLFFNKGSFVDEDGSELKNSCETAQGTIIEVKVEKNKVCKPDRRLGSYTLRFDSGIDVVSDMIEMALHYGIITRRGAWYYLSETEKYNGKAELLAAMRADSGDMMRKVVEKEAAG